MGGGLLGHWKEGQRTTCMNLFLSFSTWVQRIKLRSLALEEMPYWLSHHTSPCEDSSGTFFGIVLFLSDWFPPQKGLRRTANTDSASCKFQAHRATESHSLVESPLWSLVFAHAWFAVWYCRVVLGELRGYRGCGEASKCPGAHYTARVYCSDGRVSERHFQLRIFSSYCNRAQSVPRTTCSRRLKPWWKRVA